MKAIIFVFILSIFLFGSSIIAQSQKLMSIPFSKYEWNDKKMQDSVDGYFEISKINAESSKYELKVMSAPKQHQESIKNSLDDSTNTKKVSHEISADTGKSLSDIFSKINLSLISVAPRHIFLLKGTLSDIKKSDNNSYSFLYISGIVDSGNLCKGKIEKGENNQVFITFYDADGGLYLELYAHDSLENSIF
jgi:flagellar biosynthesis regulator FlaF